MNRGAILIITLWILAILAILSIGIGGRMGLELKLTGFNRDSAAALYLSEAGVKRAAAVILSKKNHTMDTLNEQWSCNNEEANPLFKDIKIGEAGTFTVSYHSSDKRVFYGVQDEEARININNAPGDVIKRLIEYFDLTEDAGEIAASIEDWRDEDDIRKAGSQEYVEYDYTEEGYKKKDLPFDSIDEVLLVKGVNRELFDKIKGYITVYPITGTGCRINVNTAPLPVLMALGFSQTEAETIIAARIGPDTPDNTHFVDKNDFIDFLSGANITSLTEANKALVSCGSNYYRVISKGYASGGRAVKTVTCVISVTGGSVLYWNEE